MRKQARHTFSDQGLATGLDTRPDDALLVESLKMLRESESIERVQITLSPASAEPGLIGFSC